MYAIITIGRQAGSGGLELGKRLADALGYKFYDKELISIAAQKSGLREEFLESFDEKHTSSLLYSLVMSQPNAFYAGGQQIPVGQMAATVQREAVLSVAGEPCVIVGRAADYILRGRPGLFRVFVCADEEKRVARVAETENLTPARAREQVKKIDRARMNFYNYHTDRQWGDPSAYDLCVNSLSLGLDRALELLKSAVCT